jgi:AcrR family transcriptional regulator
MRMQIQVGHRRLGRGEWIEEGLLVLGERGVEAVRVEALAKRLGVTKGSFYHHFSDRNELLVALLDAWYQQATLSVIQVVNRHSRRPEERLRRLLTFGIDGLGRDVLRLVDIGIRDWARHNRLARSMLESVDRARLAYITERLLALGCDRHEAESRSFLIYSYILGEVQIAAVASRAARIERMERCLAGTVLDLPGVGSVEEALS